MAKDTKSTSTPTGTWNPESVKVTRQLNAAFKMEKEKPYLIQMLSETYVDASRGNQEEGKKGKGRQYAPPTMVRVLDLTDGRELDLILSTIPLKRIEESYPDGAHVGLCFRIVKHAIPEGKNYSPFDIDEIDGSESPNYRDPAQVKREMGKYGPRKVAGKAK